MKAGRALTPRPRDVPGFAEARALGRTPTRPDAPPTPLAGPTAREEVRRLGAFLAGAVLASAGTALAVPKTAMGQFTTVALAIFLSVSLVAFFVLRAALVRFRNRLLDELQAGYVTTTFVQGGFWLGQRRNGGVLGWDWSGLWVLARDGEVVSPPDPDRDPPGLYPSPLIAGERELWTGYQWSGAFPDRHR